MKQVLKNHVAIVIDRSGSMSGLLEQVRQVFQNQIEFLRKTSLLFEQETRVSVYAFDNTVDCWISDTDVARPMEIERINAGGSTALMDAVGLAIEDLNSLPEKYGSHAKILYLLTDGEENASRKYNVQSFKKMISGLQNNFTICALAPNNNAVRYLENYGFPKGNIDKWDTTQKGVEEVGRKFEASMTNYFKARSTGQRSFSTVFSDLNNVTTEQVKQIANEVKNYEVVSNNGVKAVQIRPLVEQHGISYVIGKSFYELVKRETVQDSKIIAVQDKKTGKVYAGYDARQLLNLPDRGEVKIDPVNSPKWNVYVQSTSVNRNVIPKQRVLVIK
jgi:uncharacterized protein YegL